MSFSMRILGQRVYRSAFQNFIHASTENRREQKVALLPCLVFEEGRESQI